VKNDLIHVVLVGSCDAMPRALVPPSLAARSVEAHNRTQFSSTQHRSVRSDGRGAKARNPMKPQFSLAHLTALGCPPPELTYIAAMAGYDFVSPRIIHMGLPGEPNYALAANAALLRQTRAALRETGVRVHDIELARIHDGVDVKTYLPALEVGAELGARSVLSSIWTADRGLAVEALQELCDRAQPLGLTVDVEFVTWAGVANLQQTLEVLRAVKRDNVGVMIDALHFHRSRVQLEELDAVPRDWFHFAHLCDAPRAIPSTKEGLIHTARDERLYVGEGGIDVAAIVNRMPKVVYSIELPHLARAKELGHGEHARRCLRTAKAYLAAHPRRARRATSARGGAEAR
jgi:sugar phosphate isomerase/epimerase